MNRYLERQVLRNLAILDSINEEAVNLSARGRYGISVYGAANLIRLLWKENVQLKQEIGKLMAAEKYKNS